MTTSQKLDGKALIVGASGGMGRATAIALAQAGANLALMGRNSSAIESVAADCRQASTNAYPITCDIARTETIESAVNQAIDRLEGLNYLINCAGISASAKLHETDLVDSEAIIDTNLRAFLYLARYALPEINKNSGGAVIKIGSVNHPYSGVNTSLAANQGSKGLAEALFEDVREYGTKVCTIRPGWVNTPLVTADGIDKALMIQPEDIAQTVLFVLSMPDTACPTEITILPQRSPYV
ncbi:MAG: SDR family NAD(P)-dependent oxidoreductase [Gammaproteobacteria bacterium]|nr:MAG: SDR family NAD(P)-dependent oxidoreductase [Gammaproteobacteria bacterium]